MTIQLNPENECTKPLEFSRLNLGTGRNSESRTSTDMDARLTFHQLQVNESWTSPSRTITETDVVNFANITGDFNPLHVNHEFASNTPYRQPVAHGLLGLSWVAGLGSNAPAVDTVAFVCIREWNFLRPLFFGDTVHVETTVIEKQENPKRNGRVVWRMQLINQKGELTQSGEFETLVRVSAVVPDPHLNLGKSKIESAKVQSEKRNS